MSEESSVQPRRYAVVGNPNCGKTTLFNALTGLRQKVGNYPGVTVEKKSGYFIGQHGEKIELLDLPGSYSLSAHAPDERVTRNVLLGLRSDTARPDRVLCVVDASHLERNLYFITQVLELGLPSIIALNMVDLAEAGGVFIDAKKLSEKLGVPVIPCQAQHRETLLPLKLALSRAEMERSNWALAFPSALMRAVDTLAALSAKNELLSLAIQSDENSKQRDPLIRVKSMLLLTAPDVEIELLAAELHMSSALGVAVAQRVMLDRELPTWREELIGVRYEQINKTCQTSQGRSTITNDETTHRLDEILTHPFWGWVGFLGIMSLMFVSIFVVAAYPMEWIEKGFDLLGDGIKGILPAGDLRDLLSDGVVAGIGGVITFLPQILVLFFFIGLLEDTGYMARAAFLMDRVMSKVGLHGKSFIPLLSSYACAIPGIMATRTIENAKDRLVTILVAPLMSCSARLPVYALMIAALFPAGAVSVWTKGAIMMGLYLFGTVAALAFAWLFKKTILRGETPIFLMELPPYRCPAIKHIFLQMFQRASMFLKRAGTVILGISILLWFLASFPKVKTESFSGEPDKAEQLDQSYAGHLGHFLEPVIAPLGFDWKMGIGLVAAQAAREVFISTLAIIYHVEGDEKEVKENSSFLRLTLLKEKRSNGLPVYTPLTCLSLLVFFVLSMQCISTLAVVRRETNSLRWPIFQFCYMTGAAYLASLLVYQGGMLLGFH
ncbi:MAG: ferrous iron transport protein B [Chthoniobacterales bacterium]|nr:ferrous iron transport protein B [Chthoniobacterales bacterium]